MNRLGYEPILKRTRWCFLKRPENLTYTQSLRLKDVDLKTVRAYLLKEAFRGFWEYTSPYWAGWYLDKWCARAMRSRLEPIKRFVTTIRGHRELLLNWFRAKKEISSGRKPKYQSATPLHYVVKYRNDTFILIAHPKHHTKRM